MLSLSLCLSVSLSLCFCHSSPSLIAHGSISSTSSLNSDSLPLSSPTLPLPESPFSKLALEEEGQYYITPLPGPKGKIAGRNVT